MKLATAYALYDQNDKATEYYRKHSRPTRSSATTAEPSTDTTPPAQRRWPRRRGKDEPTLDDAAKAKLRRQALDWLKAELTAWSKQLESGPPQSRPLIAQT